MSSPAEYYNSLPPVSKAYGTLCLLTTTAFQLGLINPVYLYLDYDLVVKQLQAFSFVPALRSPFLGISLVFMLVYIWAREYPNAQVNISGLFTLKGFYLPWVMLALNVIFGSRLLPDLMGIIVGHLYYFLTELHPRTGGRNILKTPLWVHKIVARWNVGVQATNPVRVEPTAGTAFRGRSYRIGR